MRVSKDQSGFTLTELLVVMGLFSLFASMFYTVMFAGQRGGNTTQDMATISQEARLGLNRMIRDTREAAQVDGLLAATPTSYRVRVDFNGDGDLDDEAEDVTYAYDAVGRRITISTIPAGGSVTETLVAGVEPIPGHDMFTFTSNRLEYDTSPTDGVTTIAELDAAAAAGASLPGNRLAYISSVGYAMRVTSGTQATDFYAQAQLRSRR